MKDKLDHMLFLAEIDLIIVEGRKANAPEQDTDIFKSVVIVSDKIGGYLAVVED